MQLGWLVMGEMMALELRNAALTRASIGIYDILGIWVWNLLWIFKVYTILMFFCCVSDER